MAAWTHLLHLSETAVCIVPLSHLVCRVWAAVEHETRTDDKTVVESLGTQALLDDEDPEHSSGPDNDLETTSSSIRL